MDNGRHGEEFLGDILSNMRDGPLILMFTRSTHEIVGNGSLRSFSSDAIKLIVNDGFDLFQVIKLLEVEGLLLLFGELLFGDTAIDLLHFSIFGDEQEDAGVLDLEKLHRFDWQEQFPELNHVLGSRKLEE